MPELIVDKEALQKLQDAIIKKLFDNGNFPQHIIERVSANVNIQPIIESVLREIPEPKDGIDGKDGEFTQEILSRLTVETVKQVRDIMKDGVDGKDGIDGRNGIDGRQGIQGIQGLPGRDGESIVGPPGPEGKRGPEGLPGIDGKKGDKGDKGDRGEPGKSISMDEIQLPEIDLKPFAKSEDIEKKFKKLINDFRTKKIQLPYGSGDGWLTGKPLIDEINKAISKGSEFNYIDFSESYTGTIPNEEGVVFWNKDEISLDVVTGYGPVLQIGQEMYLLYYNDTGVDIPCCKVVRPKAAVDVGGVVYPTPELAHNVTHLGAQGTVTVTTMDIPNGSIGLTTRFGRVRDIDTSMWSPGDDLFIDSTPGELTNVKPAFPDYVVSMGGALKIDASEGEIFVTITGDVYDTTLNFWNGTFRESINFTVSSNGTTITGNLDTDNGHDDMTMIFSDGLSILDTSPSIDIVLTPGTDSIPQTNFVYVPKLTKLLANSTSGWPTTEHIKVATVVLRSAAITQSDGALGNRNHNDHIQSTQNQQGHLPHIADRIRQIPAQWDSGAESTASGFPSNFYVSTTAGKVYQLHLQDFPAQSMPTADIHIVNNFANPYVTVNNLNTQTLGALGTTLANYSFSFVVWGVVNRTGQMSHLMCNLPTGKYAKNAPASAVADAFNYSVYDIPDIFRGTGFLIARFTLILEPDGITWTLYDTEDLRGKIPNTTAGGGAGGTGVTTFAALTDTPSTFVAGQIPRVNTGATALDFTSPGGLAGLKTGTLAAPPTGLKVNEFWEDTTDSTNHPLIRQSKVTT